MTNRPRKAASKSCAPERALPSDPRYELVFETRSFAKRTLPRRAPERVDPSNLFAELRSLGKRGGAVLGDVYAVAAGYFLDHWERLEDLNAERRLRQRSKASPAGRAGRSSGRAIPRPASKPKNSLPPAK
jgi:hypothetical protein